MRLVFTSPQDRQVKTIHELLLKSGIASTMVYKNFDQRYSTKSSNDWAEVWVKRNNQHDQARAIIAQHETKALQQQLRPQHSGWGELATQDTSNSPSNSSTPHTHSSTVAQSKPTISQAKQDAVEPRVEMSLVSTLFSTHSWNRSLYGRTDSSQAMPIKLKKFEHKSYKNLPFKIPKTARGRI